mmetsp:Transcript_81837/g.264253  ORF Transcript_81837/g.264253 Transcript_81837/m.264253 type:complete len:87 (+) Transcript_81837:508-768(+)
MDRSKKDAVSDAALNLQLCFRSISQLEFWAPVATISLPSLKLEVFARRSRSGAQRKPPRCSNGHGSSIPENRAMPLRVLSLTCRGC